MTVDRQAAALGRSGRRPANRRLVAEDRADFVSHAAGASHLSLGADRRRCGGGWPTPIRLGARADRSRRQAGMRVLRAVPRRADAARSDDEIPPEQIAQIWRSSPRSRNACGPIRSRTVSIRLPALAAQGRPEGDAGHLARQQPAEESRSRSHIAVALAKEYPGVITALVVGNEVLLRGEMTTADLVANIRLVKSQVDGAGDLCRRLGILAAQPRGL